MLTSQFNICGYPKIHALGHRNVINIFADEVEITEKVDGSQFVFGKDMNGKLHIRSKGKQIDIDAPPQMFQLGVDYVLRIQDRILNDTSYYCEYLNKPKHNTLVYDRVPLNNLVLFGASDFCRTEMVRAHVDLTVWATNLGIDVIPLIYTGKLDTAEDVLGMMKRKSYLGGKYDIEGIVVKNYHQSIELNGQVYPVVTGKYVSDAFKEVHQKTWKAENTAKGGWDATVSGYRTEARWMKSIQHLKEDGKLDGSPKDIGPLIKAIHDDIREEEKEAILAVLWRQFSPSLFRVATSGFPEFYKELLVKESFLDEPTEFREVYDGTDS